MSDHEDEDVRLHPSSTAFSVHLKRFDYTPPKNDMPPKALVQTFLVTPTKNAGWTTAKNKDGQSTSKQSKRKLNVGAYQSLPKRRTTTKERSANDPYEPDNKLVDSIRPGLMLIFIGLNPGLETARTGHSYAHATNQFWPLLYNSGITPVLHKAADTQLMPDLYNFGNTNLCARATRSGDGLTKQEQFEGAIIVEAKIVKCRPEAVCIVGKGIWDTIYKSKTGKTLKRQDFAYGWQHENLWLGRAIDKNGDVACAGSRTFVCTSTSGLAADTKPAEKLEIMSKLGEWVKQRRKELIDDGVERDSDPRVGSHIREDVDQEQNFA